MLRKRIKKKKPLLLITKQKLHSKSTYFYKQWSSWTSTCHNIFANGFRGSSRHCEQSLSGFRLRDGANPTRSSLVFKNPYSKNAYGRLGLNKSYILPVTCSLALLLVLGIAINPSICSNAKSFALEGEGEDGSVVVSDKNMDEGGTSSINVSNDEVAESDKNTVESNNASENTATTDDVSNNARTTTSIAINWDMRDPEEQEAHGSSGEVLYRYNRFTLSANKIKQYQILVNAATGSSNNLVGYLDAEHTTPLNAEISGISDTNGATGSNIPENQWGYALVKGDVTTAGGLANLNYKAVPSASDSTIALTGNEETLDNQEFTVAFGANVGADKPAGHYTAYVTVSAVMEPRELYWDELVYMQDMNPTACLQATLNTQKTLIDSRDGSKYNVARIKNKTDDDSLCWMTQNLKIMNTTISSDDSDMVSGSFTIPLSTGINSSNIDSPQMHYDSTYGGYYNWFTAVAGTIDSSEKTPGLNASSSICPKGWRLPVGGDDGEFKKLVGGLTAEQVARSPYSFTKGGFMSSFLLDGGKSGNYWSSTIYAAVVYSFRFETGALGSADLAFPTARDWGYSVRCVAR